MIGWRYAEALEADTRQVVAKWWEVRRPPVAAPIPDGLVKDLQAARLALDDGLHRRLWDFASVLREPQRSHLIMRIAELDPWHVPSHTPARSGRTDAAAVKREGPEDDDRELIAALKESARRRERLERPEFPSKARRCLRDFVRGRGGLAAVLKDDDACRMLRFGAVLCDLMEVDLNTGEDPDPDEVRAEFAKLSEAAMRRAADAVLNDPLVGSDDRGRPAEPELLTFVRAVIGAVKRHVGDQLKRSMGRGVRSDNMSDAARPDVQLILDLVACHAPSRKEGVVADLIKKARSS